MQKTKLKIYLETTVPNALLDSSKPERQLITQQFWKNLKNFQAYISDLVDWEINNTQNPKLREQLKQTIKPFNRLSNKNQEIQKITQAYVDHQIIPQTHRIDAEHLAIATYHQIEIFISWNFKHLVKLKTIEQANAINKLLGYQQLKIVEPSILLYD